MAKCVNCNKEVSFWSSKIEGDYHYCDNCWNNTNEEEREKIVEQKERSKQIQIGKEIRKRDKKFLDMNFWSWCLNNNEFFLYLGLLVLIFWFLIGFNDIVYAFLILPSLYIIYRILKRNLKKRLENKK